MHWTSVVRLACAGLLGFGALGCLRVSRTGVSVSIPVPVSPALESRIINDTTPPRAGQLSSAQLDTIAPHVRALRVTPHELAQTVGDSIRVRELVRVLAIDSAGSVLGELPYFDYGFSGRGARLLADGRLVLGRAGTVRYTAQFPQAHWRGRASTRPSATVLITVFGNGS